MSGHRHALDAYIQMLDEAYDTKATDASRAAELIKLLRQTKASWALQTLEDLLWVGAQLQMMHWPDTRGSSLRVARLASMAAEDET